MTVPVGLPPASAASPGSPASLASPVSAPVGLRAREVSAPVARCSTGRTADGSDHGSGRARTTPAGTVVGVFAHSVSIRCQDPHGVPLIVSLSDVPVDSVAQARIPADRLADLRLEGIGTPVALETAGAAVVASRITTHGTPAVFSAPASWFDTADGRRFGVPRLERAAEAIWGDQDAEALEALCGLGIGLTPSGDDALIGLIATARTAGLGTRVIGRFTEILTSPRAAGLTTETSLCHLRLAVGGDFSATVLDLLDALIADHDSTTTGQPRILTAVARLAHTGHSSGADLMAGVAALTRRLAHQQRSSEPSESGRDQQ
ncbi:MAG: DUF2877 domain-containing protein [Acidipropionibacterium jensenii]|nr:DUF2877 domain-containing protein [Acidipropionibacterium jensenii]